MLNGINDNRAIRVNKITSKIIGWLFLIPTFVSTIVLIIKLSNEDLNFFKNLSCPGGVCYKEFLALYCVLTFSLGIYFFQNKGKMFFPITALSYILAWLLITPSILSIIFFNIDLFTKNINMFDNISDFFNGYISPNYLMLLSIFSIVMAGMGVVIIKKNDKY
jgi:hypothetical protein